MRAVVAVEEGDVAVKLRARRCRLLRVVDGRGAGLVLDEVAAWNACPTSCFGTRSSFRSSRAAPTSNPSGVRAQTVVQPSALPNPRSPRNNTACPPTLASASSMISDVLEADRKAMGLDQYEYIGHLLARRYNEIRDQGGPGFEKKSKERK